MTDNPTTPPYRDGQTFESTTDDSTWTITSVDRNYQLRIERDGDGEDDGLDEEARFPEPTLVDKLDRGDLQPVPTAPDGPPAGEPVECTECEKEFSSEQGMKAHRTQVHGTDGADEPGADDPAE